MSPSKQGWGWPFSLFSLFDAAELLRAFPVAPRAPLT